MRSLGWAVLGGALLPAGIAACSLVTSLDGLSSGGGGPEGSDGGPGDEGGLGAAEGGGPVLDGSGGGQPTDAPALDAASDAPDAASTGTRDAGSGGSDTGPAADAGPPSPFAKLVQIDVSTLLTANTVVTTQKPDSGAPIVWADGFFGQHDFATNAETNALMPGSPGLPDDGHFAGNGTTIPPVTLPWNDALNSDNSVLLQNQLADAGVASQLAFSVPKANYQQLQIYVTGTHGTAGVASNLGVTLIYADKSTSSSTLVVPAWDTDVSVFDGGPGERVLVSHSSPVDATTRTINTGFSISIFAIDLDPNPSKALVGVALVDRGGDPTQYAFETVIFYGATAW